MNKRRVFRKRTPHTPRQKTRTRQQSGLKGELLRQLIGIFQGAVIALLAGAVITPDMRSIAFMGSAYSGAMEIFLTYLIWRRKR